MARFYGGVWGNRGEVNCCGSMESGMSAFANGWDIGASVQCFVDDDGEDQVVVRLTGGTNAKASELHLGWWKNVNGVIVPIFHDKPDKLFGTWRIVNNSLVLE